MRRPPHPSLLGLLQPPPQLSSSARGCASSLSPLRSPTLSPTPFSAMALPPQLMHTLEGLKYQVKDALMALSSCICQQSAKVKINGRTCAQHS